MVTTSREDWLTREIETMEVKEGVNFEQGEDLEQTLIESIPRNVSFIL